MGAELAAIDVLLGLGILATAACALLPRTRLAVAMGFLALGVVVSLVWLRLGSVDVALAETALGGGVLGAVLVWLAIRSRSAPAAQHRAAARWRVALGVFAAVVLTGLCAAVWGQVVPQIAAWSQPVQQQMPQTGVDHGVTAVLLAFRAYDTLLETAVLLMAAVAVMALSGEGAEHPARLRVQPRSSTLTTLARFSAPVLLLVGLWLLFAGSSQSGGAFQAGAVLCAMLILLRVAGAPIAEATVRWMPAAAAVGVLSFVLAGLIGPVSGGSWLSGDPQWAGAAIVVIEVFLTVSITAGLYMIYLGLDDLPSTRKHLGSQE